MCRQLYFKIISTGFDSSSNPNNTLIHSFGHYASSVDADVAFFQLSQPDKVAWNAWIASYAQEGDFKHSLIVFQSMQLATGNFKKVKRVLSAMPVQANLPLWLSLLGACQTHGNLEFAKEAFKQAMDLQPSYSAAYVLISNMHVSDFAQE
ncbi:hypothetical protein L7F22_023431 [Adiantum nelumboides]|nr:hypothetical protein [Adiantum nelumboides]